MFFNSSNRTPVTTNSNLHNAKALGLSDEYTYNPGGNSISAADKDNLMNYGGDKSKLRYNQWRTVNP